MPSSTSASASASNVEDPNTLDDKHLKELVTGLLFKDPIQLLLRKPTSKQAVIALVDCLPRDALVDYVNCVRKTQFAYQLRSTYSLSEDLEDKGQASIYAPFLADCCRGSRAGQPSHQKFQS